MTGTRLKVLLVGNYPPPFGGVSVQVSALCHLLDATPGFTCRVLDIGDSRRQKRPDCLPARNFFDFGWKLLSHAARQYVIHLHTNGHNLKSWWMGLACAVAGIFNGRRTVLTLGSGSAPDFIREASGPIRLLVTITLALTGAIITRNERARTTLAGLGVPPNKIEILSGFYGLRMAAREAIPERIDEFLRCHVPVLGAIASSGPEYGIPLVLEAATRLRALYPRLGVLLMGPEEVRDHRLDGDLLPTGELPHEVVLAVMQKIDLFTRPTYFDGDASSVREALALGVPVVASDTDFRPEGVILFRRGDVQDLTEKIARALRNGQTEGGGVPGVQSGSLEQLLAIYARLATRTRFMRSPA